MKDPKNFVGYAVRREFRFRELAPVRMGTMSAAAEQFTQMSGDDIIQIAREATKEHYHALPVYRETVSQIIGRKGGDTYGGDLIILPSPWVNPWFEGQRNYHGLLICEAHWGDDYPPDDQALQEALDTAQVAHPHQLIYQAADDLLQAMREGFLDLVRQRC